MWAVDLCEVVSSRVLLTFMDEIVSVLALFHGTGGCVIPPVILLLMRTCTVPLYRTPFFYFLYNMFVFSQR